MAVMERPDGVMVVSKSVRNEQRAANTRRAGDSILAPLTTDGDETRKLLAEIQNFMLAAGEDGCRDKVVAWRREVRASRYRDWVAANGIAP